MVELHLSLVSGCRARRTWTARASTSGQYDVVGNQLAFAHTFSSQAVRTYTNDEANRRLTSVDGPVYTCDNNGNPSASSGHALLCDGEKTYTYDQANRLIRVTRRRT